MRSHNTGVGPIFAALLALTLPASAAIKARDKTVGMCTREDEFLAKLESIDPFVQKLSAAKTDGDRDEKPYARLSKRAEPWTETLDGPEGARRVEWQWVVKGKNSFNEYDASTYEVPVAKEFCYPVSWYKDSLFGSYPRKSFGAGGGRHAGEDCAWFREGCSFYAIADGLVRMVQGAGGDWGFLIVVEHQLENGEYVTAVYGHCAWDVLVKPGDLVRKGQKIGTQGLSASVENGGYGSHLHFGIGHGPYRRSGKIQNGSEINLRIDGDDRPATVVRFGYTDKEKNKFGWPRVTALVELGGGKDRIITLPEEAPGAELAWMKAYTPRCRGWLNPQSWLPNHVDIN